MRIYFTRHGESQANILHEISNRGLRHPLTRTGRQQALALAGRLAGLADAQGPLTRVYTSPLLRAIETGVILANHLDLDFEVTTALREFNCGLAEGRSDETAWGMWHWVVDEWQRYGRWDSRIEGGESFNQVRERFVGFVDGLVQQYRDSAASLVCVAHGGLYEMMLPQVLCNLTYEQMLQRKLNYTTCIVVETRPQGLVCLEWDGEKV